MVSFRYEGPSGAFVTHCNIYCFFNPLQAAIKMMITRGRMSLKELETSMELSKW